MKTLEEKAKAYADRPTTAKTWGMSRIALEDAYIAGATEALAGQWRRVEDELPKRGVDVLICTDKGQVKQSCWQGNEKQANDTYHRHIYWKWWGNSYPYVLYWMPIPEPPKDESECPDTKEKRSTIG